MIKKVNRMKRYIFCIILCSIFFTTLTGCLKKEANGKREDVVYVICKRNVIPQQLGELIDEAKKNTFHFTYTTGEFTYYIIGYGRQPGNGYKIKVKEFCADKTHIYIDTILTGVTKEHQREGISYPYIILKSQFYEKDVIFH